MKEIVKTLSNIERDCSYLDAYSQTQIEYEKFYERVKGVMTITGEKSLKKIEEDCRYGNNYIEFEKFYERVKGIIILMS
jgi:hypothetical protein